MNQNIKLATLVFLVFQVCSFASLKVNLNPKPYFVENCNGYDKSGKCIRCIGGYVFTPLDDQGKTHCQRMINGCSKYSSSGACTACESGRVLQHEANFDNICVCPPGTTSLYDGRVCLIPSKTIPGCQQLSSMYSCETCQEGYYKEGVYSPETQGIKNICKSCKELFNGKCSICQRWAGRVICDSV
jgi:hypothetical protein